MKPLDEELLVAARMGHHAAVERLLRDGADITVQDNKGRTVFLCAAESGSVECFKVLLARLTPQTDHLLGVQDNEGNTLLHCAVRHRHIHLAKEILNECKIFNEIENDIGELPIHIAVGQDDVECLQLFLPDFIDAQNKKNGNTPLLLAIQNKAANCVTVLMPAANLWVVNKLQQTPLHVAVSFKCYTALQLLIHRDECVQMINAQDCRGRDPLYLTVANGDHEAFSLLEQLPIVRMRCDLSLLRKSISLNAGALILPILNGRYINLNVQEEEGLCPLSEYILRMSVFPGVAGRALVQAGARLLFRNRDGTTPLESLLTKSGALDHKIEFLLDFVRFAEGNGEKVKPPTQDNNLRLLHDCVSKLTTNLKREAQNLIDLVGKTPTTAVKEIRENKVLFLATLIECLLREIQNAASRDLLLGERFRLLNIDMQAKLREVEDRFPLAYRSTSQTLFSPPKPNAEEYASSYSVTYYMYCQTFKDIIEFRKELVSVFARIAAQTPDKMPQVTTWV